MRGLQLLYVLLVGYVLCLQRKTMALLQRLCCSLS